MVLIKRSQAAMEFLLTYGWAILIVLVVIAALAYFGILSPQKLLPDKCFFQIGVSCVDFSASSEGYPIGDTMVQTPDELDDKIYSLNFDLINNLGQDVYVTKVSITGKDIDCTEIQYETCDAGTSFVEFFSDNMKKDPPEVVFDPSIKCVSIKEACNPAILGVCGIITPETIIRWSNGARLRQGVVLINSEHLSMLCYKMPPKGQKTDGIVTIEYTRDNPSENQNSLKHTIYGELHTTVT